MFQTSSVGATTTVCSLKDQVKSYKANSIAASNQETSSYNNNTTIIPSLKTLCLRILSSNFCKNNSTIPAQFLPEITARLPVDLPLVVAASNILDENYWKRRCLAETSWKNLQISSHGQSWRQAYLELYVQSTIEDFDPSVSTLEELQTLVIAARDSVFTLSLSQLLSHLDLQQLLTLLPNLTRLSLTYGVKSIGMAYERMLFGMKISDATSLSRYISTSMEHCLTTLVLKSNLIDDDLLRMLMNGLVTNDTITYLDLSHNKISNHGARLLSKLLQGSDSCILSTLVLTDNQIHSEGGRYLGSALAHNTSLTSLNLRLNRLEDAGGAFVLSGMLQSKSSSHHRLSSLSLSSNSLAPESAKVLATVLRQNLKLLRNVDLTGNDFNEEDLSIILKDGLENNEFVTGMDLRMNQVRADADVLRDIASMLRRNETRMRNNNIT